MSRRHLGVVFLAGAAALGVLGPASARAPTPAKYGGTVVVGLGGGDPANLDPTLVAGTAIGIYKVMCQRLYEYDAKLSYTIQLRKGVQFNDGTPFNAQAVVTTVQRYMTYPGSIRSSDYASVDSVTATGPYTLVYHLKQRDSTFTGNPYVLSPTQLAKLGDNFTNYPVCVGPFMFDNRVVGDHITVIKSPYYYDQKNVYLDKIVFETYLSGFSASPDPNSLINSFLATSGARNLSGYSNPRLDLNIANGLKATDTKARSTLYRVAQQIIHDERPIIYLYNLNVFAAFSASLAGVQLSPSGTLLVENARYK